MNFIHLIWISIIVFIIGFAAGRYSFSDVLYHRAYFSGMIEQCRREAITDSDREFYENWQVELKKRGYMWGEP